MAREDRAWHPDFIAYMEEIVHHPNYAGLPIHRKPDGSLAWIATKQSEIGKARIAWCEAKARELGFPIEPGVSARVMREIHPTKWKVCQICGRRMSIYYHYPSAHCLQAIQKRFGVEYSRLDHISDLWDDLVRRGFPEYTIAEFFIDYGGLQGLDKTASKAAVIDALEKACRIDGKKLLSPGAMSNFPDRFDGFHTYNLCCRAAQDRGRSKENLRSYTQDRRAYEYWSGGRIHAANQFMGSDFFRGTTADHVGPISLGFVHDPAYLQPMPGSDNSAKRDRLQKADLDKIIQIEKRTNICPMSWFSRELWNYIRENYLREPEKIPTVYRDALKQNMSNFMFILWYLMEFADGGREFLIRTLLAPQFRDFSSSYTFNEQGDIIRKEERHFTERNVHELERYIRVAVDSVYDFQAKENRNLCNDLTEGELEALDHLCDTITQTIPCAAMELKALMLRIQGRLIQNMM